MTLAPRVPPLIPPLPQNTTLLTTLFGLGPTFSPPKMNKVVRLMGSRLVSEEILMGGPGPVPYHWDPG